MAIRAASVLPGTLLRLTDPDGVSGAQKVDALLTEQALAVDPDTLRRIGAHLRGYLDPDGARFDTEAHRRRSLSLQAGDDGTVCGRFALPGAQGASLKAAIDHYAKPQPSSEQPDADGNPTLVADDRTRLQRQADALDAIARIALAAAGQTDSGNSRPEPPHVVVITTLEQLAAVHAAAESPGGATSPAFIRSTGPGATAAAPGTAHCVQTGPLSTATLAALACDALLQAVVLDRSGAVLDLGRAVRTATPAQRRALAARDRGCVIPGCHAPPGACDAHHLRWWSQGGGTDLLNLALVCGRHHADIHAGIWTLVMLDGIPHAIPPPWADPGRPRLRNTVHHSQDVARRLARQLLLDLDPAGPEQLDDTG